MVVEQQSLCIFQFFLSRREVYPTQLTMCLYRIEPKRKWKKEKGKKKEKKNSFLLNLFVLKIRIISVVITLL